RGSAPAQGLPVAPVFLSATRQRGEILGKGTFGEVVKSWRRSKGEMVAIKILKNDAYRRRIIKNELKLLQTMAGVDSEESHIIRFHEFFHDEMKFYLVFELLEQNLFDFQKENNFSPLPVKHIRTVTAQVLKALAKLKELSIIHTDLKPENIMLVDQMRYPFRVKVIDFGSASIFNEVRYLTLPPPFPTQVLEDNDYGRAVDWWGLGVVMYEMMCGRLPFYNQDHERLFELILMEEIRFPRTLSPEAKALLAGLLKKDPKQRWVGAGHRHPGACWLAPGGGSCSAGSPWRRSGLGGAPGDAHGRCRAEAKCF
uniref:Homeodomain interacting protein kinase 4 n=1 Tax=Chelydra serpentina TaxID=8475 RepID=A0A8C3T5I8_CHESE